MHKELWIESCETGQAGLIAATLAGVGIHTLAMATTTRSPSPGLIHHSDRGVQYACGDYTDLLEAHDIQSSMSRIGNPYDNAKAESFMKTLKQEEVDGRSYRDAHQTRNDIGAFIEEVYNRQRLHSALAYQSPAEFEAQHRGQIATASVDARQLGFLRHTEIFGDATDHRSANAKPDNRMRTSTPAASP